MNPNYFTETGKVICQLCNKQFNIISPTHLKKDHNSSVSEYKKQFPDAPVSSQQFKAKQRFKASGLFEDGKTEESYFEELVPKKEETIKDEDAILKKLKDEIEDSTLKKLIPSDDKRSFYIQLKKRYPSLQINYRIEVYALNEILQYSTITDLADPKTKTDFEFPYAMWHNQDRLFDRNRSTKLSSFGWRVISFDKAPSIEELEVI